MTLIFFISPFQSRNQCPAAYYRQMCQSVVMWGEGCGLTFQSRLIEGHLLLEMTYCYTKGSKRAPQVRISLIIRILITQELRDGATG